MVVRLRPAISSFPVPTHPHSSLFSKLPLLNSTLKLPSLHHIFTSRAAKMFVADATSSTPSSIAAKVIDSHLHVWDLPEEAADKYPYFPGQEPTLPGNVDFLLERMEEAGIDGALIVQPINHKFDHSYVKRCVENVNFSIGKAKEAYHNFNYG